MDLGLMTYAEADEMIEGLKAELAAEKAEHIETKAELEEAYARRDATRATHAETQTELTDLKEHLRGWPPITDKECGVLVLEATHMRRRGMPRTGELLLRLLKRPPADKAPT